VNECLYINGADSRGPKLINVYTEVVKINDTPNRHGLLHSFNLADRDNLVVLLHPLYLVFLFILKSINRTLLFLSFIAAIAQQT